jgi:hypothetical protein
MALPGSFVDFPTTTAGLMAITPCNSHGDTPVDRHLLNQYVFAKKGNDSIFLSEFYGMFIAFSDDSPSFDTHQGGHIRARFWSAKVSRGLYIQHGLYLPAIGV